MLDLNDLYYFVHVVDQRGFAAAGRKLGIPKSRLSRRIADLESRLGVRLLQRSTRQFSVTPVGEVYYAHCKAMLIEAETAEDSIAAARTEPCGTLSVSCPVELLYTRVNAMLIDFMGQHPALTVHLYALNRAVDVVDEGIDVAIRVRPPPLEDSDLIMRTLGERRQCLVASPQLLTGRTLPTTPAELAHLPSMALGIPQTAFEWTLFDTSGQQQIVRHQPRLITRAMLTLRRAAVAGIGIVQLPHMMVRNELENGQLMQLLPDWTLPGEIVHAIYASRRGMLPAVRALLDHLADAFSALDED